MSVLVNGSYMYDMSPWMTVGMHTEGDYMSYAIPWILLNYDLLLACEERLIGGGTNTLMRDPCPTYNLQKSGIEPVTVIYIRE